MSMTMQAMPVVGVTMVVPMAVAHLVMVVIGMTGMPVGLLVIRARRTMLMPGRGLRMQMCGHDSASMPHLVPSPARHFNQQ
jgi:hypothetical protein